MWACRGCPQCASQTFLIWRFVISWISTSRFFKPGYKQSWAVLNVLKCVKSLISSVLLRQRLYLMCRVPAGLWGLVNNAGILQCLSDAEFQPITAYRRYMDVNFLGAVKMSQVFLPLLRRARGRLVNMSSMAGGSEPKGHQTDASWATTWRPCFFSPSVQNTQRVLISKFLCPGWSQWWKVNLLKFCTLKYLYCRAFLVSINRKILHTKQITISL